jgi:hypothetical protein
VQSAGLSQDVVAVLRPQVGRLTDDVLAAVAGVVPPSRDGGRMVRRGVEEGLRGFLELLESGAHPARSTRDVYFDFGRGELRAGRSLEALLAAYRVGAQAAWRGMVAVGDGAGLDPRELYALAELAFDYLDHVTAATVEGFSYEQSVTASEHVSARRRLVELVLREPAAPAAELHAAAADASWAVPARLAVVAFRDERVARVASRLPGDALVSRVGDTGWAVLPDPSAPGRAAAIAAALADVRCAIGPAVAPADAAESARQARLALDLPRGGPGLVRAEDRWVDLLLAGDPSLSAALAASVLGPLDALPAATSDRLLDTLEAWLGHQGEVRPTAAELHVHTQTVRYRLAQLRALLGDRLATAQGRLELELAVRARHVLPRPPRRSSQEA